MHECIGMVIGDLADLTLELLFDLIHGSVLEVHWVFWHVYFLFDAV